MQIIKKKKGTTASIVRCLSILVLSAIIVLAPSLSFQSKTNNGSKYSFGSANDNNSGNNSLPIAVFPANSKPYGLKYGE